MANNNDMLVAIIDSDRIASHSVQLLINNNFNAQVGIFYSAEDFYQKMHHMPDVIITEYNLPDANGFEVLERIKENCPQAKVIFISNQLDTIIIKRLMNCAIHDYIVKSDRALTNLQLSLEIIENENKSVQQFMNRALNKRNEILATFKGRVNKFFGGNELEELGKEIDDIKLKHPNRKL